MTPVGWVFLLKWIQFAVIVSSFVARMGPGIFLTETCSITEGPFESWTGPWLMINDWCWTATLFLVFLDCHAAPCLLSLACSQQTVVTSCLWGTSELLWGTSERNPQQKKSSPHGDHPGRLLLDCSWHSACLVRSPHPPALPVCLVPLSRPFALVSASSSFPSALPPFRPLVANLYVCLVRLPFRLHFPSALSVHLFTPSRLSAFPSGLRPPRLSASPVFPSDFPPALVCSSVRPSAWRGAVCDAVRSSLCLCVCLQMTRCSAIRSRRIRASAHVCWGAAPAPAPALCPAPAPAPPPAPAPATAPYRRQYQQQKPSQSRSR